MEEITRSSRARVVGRSRADSRCGYVSFDGVLARVRRDSWRSLSD